MLIFCLNWSSYFFKTAYYDANTVFVFNGVWGLRIGAMIK